MCIEIESSCPRKTRRTLTLKLVNDHTKNVLCMANVENWNPNPWCTVSGSHDHRPDQYPDSQIVG